MLEKNFLGLTHGFARGRRMIVNPSLQHDLIWFEIPNENEFHFHYTEMELDCHPSLQCKTNPLQKRETAHWPGRDAHCPWHPILGRIVISWPPQVSLLPHRAKDF